MQALLPIPRQRVSTMNTRPNERPGENMASRVKNQRMSHQCIPFVSEWCGRPDLHVLRTGLLVNSLESMQERLDPSVIERRTHHGIAVVIKVMPSQRREARGPDVLSLSFHRLNPSSTAILIKIYIHKSITADNGTEFHDYADIERATGMRFFFATPYHSWERGTNENTNGLIRQYAPKGMNMTHITQHRCNAIARKLNTRPRERLGFRTPEECLYEI